MKTTGSAKLKIVSFLLAAALLSGCAYRSHEEPKQTDDVIETSETAHVETSAPETRKETFYSSEKIDLTVPVPPERANMSLVYSESINPRFVGNQILVYIYNVYGIEPESGFEGTETDAFWAIFDMNGTYQGRLALDNLPSETSFTTDRNGNILAAYSRYEESGEHLQNIVKYTKFDRDGNLLSEPRDVLYEADSFVNDIVYADGFGVLITTLSHIIQIDEDGFTIACQAFDNDTGIKGLWSENGQIYLHLITYNYDEPILGELFEVTLDAKGNILLKNTGKNAESLSGMKVYQTDESIYAATRNALGKMDLSTGEFSRLLDWNQTDIDRNILAYSPVKVISEGELTQTVNVLPFEDISQHTYTEPAYPAVEQPSEPYPEDAKPVETDTYETEIRNDETSVIADSFVLESTTPTSPADDDRETKICILTTEFNTDTIVTRLIKVEPSVSNPHEGQDVVWVGGVGITDSTLMKCIAEYNRSASRNIWIKVYDYADFRFDGNFSSSKYRQKALETMAAQVDSGVGPDIIIGAGETGAFDNSRDLTNLNGYIDSPSGINRNNYFDSAIKAFEMDGKLYQIPLIYQIYAIIGNSEFMDGKKEMNYHDYMSARMLLSDDQSLFSSTSIESLLNLFLKGETATWINYANDTVEIDRNSLIDMLEFLKIEAYSGECLYSGFSSEYEYRGPMYTYNGLESLYLRQTGFTLATVNSVTDFMQGRILGDTTGWCGCPGSGGCTPIIKTPLTAGIASYSTQKDNAWEVIKYFLSKDVQTAIKETQLSDGFAFDWTIPVNIEACREVNRSLLEESGLVSSYVYGLDGQPVILDFGSVDEVLDRYVEFLKQPVRRYIRDDAVLDIVCNEVVSYLMEECTVTEAADTIIKRLQSAVEG